MVPPLETLIIVSRDRDQGRFKRTSSHPRKQLRAAQYEIYLEQWLSLVQGHWHH